MCSIWSRLGCTLYGAHLGPLGVLLFMGEKGEEALRMRVGVVCWERECFLCLSASANRKNVAAVLP